MITILGTIIAGIFGAIFGSYSTLFAYRLPIGESCFGRYFGPKSRCPECGLIIRTRELIPIINWFFTLGRCHKCQTKIPRTYLFIELATTILFILCYQKFSFSEDFIIYALMCAALVVVVAIDYNNKMFPAQILYTVLMLGLISRVLEDGGVINAILSAALGVVFSAVFYQIFCKKFNGFLTNQKQSLDYAKFIIIASVCLQPTLFLLYFLSVLAALLALAILYKSSKKASSSIGFSLVLPLIWLMLYPSF